MKSGSETARKIDRRSMLGMATGVMVLPRHILGGRGFVAPSDQLDIACIGVGGKGRSDVRGVSSENIVALCDVDFERAAETFQKFPEVKKYKDFRRMFEEVENIDAVTITTPDHTHAVIAMTAIKLGKHVYLQKPLTHTVAEARRLRQAAQEEGVATQMGNQGHAGDGNRLVCEWIWSGTIGAVREAHAWTNRPKGYWPQGAHVQRPVETPPVPETLDWDLWLGPAADRPYHPAYAPHDWRGWWDFGCGAIGDMACHIMDTPVWALKLGQPTTIQASSTPFNDDVYPLGSIVRYHFAARADMPPVELTWYDGGLMPPRPSQFKDGEKMGDKDGGVLFVGEKGMLVCGCYGRDPRVFLEQELPAEARPPEMIPRVPGIYQEWIRACKGGPSASSNFDVSGPLTEIALLGNLAIRFQYEDLKLEWNSEEMTVRNLPQANEWLEKQNQYRSGWSL